MASTLGVERKEARRLARDTDGGRYAVSTREFNRIIEAEMHRVGSRIRLGQAWQNGVITLVPATDPPDYTLPAAGVQYQQIIKLRRQSDRKILEPLSQSALQYRRRGLSSIQGTYVNAYALVEAVDQTITVMFDVKVTQGDTIDMLRSIIPASLNNDDSQAIPFDRDLLEGFRMGCAVRAINMMTPEEKAARGFTGFVARGRYIPPAHVQDMMDGYENAQRRAEIRIARMKLAGNTNALLIRDWLPGGLVPSR
jgi:hypothetical protein